VVQQEQHIQASHHQKHINQSFKGGLRFTAAAAVTAVSAEQVAKREWREMES